MFINKLNVVVISFLMISTAYAVNGDHHDIELNNSSHIGINQKPPTPPGEINHQSSMVKLEDGVITDKYMEENRPPLGKRVMGYGARCGSVACGTFVGGAIGLAIVSGELDFTTAMILLKVGSPIILGSLAGYTAGWIGGNVAKARITGRL